MINQNKRVVYLAGPMRGLPCYGFPAFDDARDKLESLGLSVISPADMNREILDFHPEDLPDDWDWDKLPEDFDLGKTLIADFRAIMRSDEVYFLKGWERSEGAQLEWAFAKLLGKKLSYEA